MRLDQGGFSPVRTADNGDAHGSRTLSSCQTSIGLPSREAVLRSIGSSLLSSSNSRSSSQSERWQALQQQTAGIVQINHALTMRQRWHWLAKPETPARPAPRASLPSHLLASRITFAPICDFTGKETVHTLPWHRLPAGCQHRGCSSVAGAAVLERATLASSRPAVSTPGTVAGGIASRRSRVRRADHRHRVLAPISLLNSGFATFGRPTMA